MVSVPPPPPPFQFGTPLGSRDIDKTISKFQRGNDPHATLELGLSRLEGVRCITRDHISHIPAARACNAAQLGSVTHFLLDNTRCKDLHMKNTHNLR